MKDFMKTFLIMVLSFATAHLLMEVTERLLPYAAHMSIWIGMTLASIIVIVVSARENYGAKKTARIDSVVSTSGMVQNGNITARIENMSVDAFRRLTSAVTENLKSHEADGLHAKVESIDEDERMISISFYSDDTKVTDARPIVEAILKYAVNESLDADLTPSQK
jgi:BioD-like phosphotransacetylase family protein